MDQANAQAGTSGVPASPYRAYSISWNLTQRCNLHCAHCYMSASSQAETVGELSTAECQRIMDEIAQVNPEVFLILTGGEPLIRKDLFDLASYASDQDLPWCWGRMASCCAKRKRAVCARAAFRGPVSAWTPLTRSATTSFAVCLVPGTVPYAPPKYSARRGWIFPSIPASPPGMSTKCPP